MKSRCAREKPPIVIEDGVPKEIARGSSFFLYRIGGLTAYFAAIVNSASEALDELRSRFREGYAEAYAEVMQDVQITAVVTPYEHEGKIVFRWVKQ